MKRAGKRNRDKPKKEKTKTYNFTYEQLQAIAERAVKERLDERFEEIDRMEQAKIVKSLLAIAVDAVITHYGDLNRKVVDGQTRPERIARLIARWYWCYAEGYVELSELDDDLKSQGIDLESILREERSNGRKS